MLVPHLQSQLYILKRAQLLRVKSQLGVCLPLRLHGAHLRGDGQDLLTGCGATQFP